MNRFARPLVNLVAVGILLAAGVVHGRWTGRWVASRDLEAAVARLEAVPDRIGEWTGRPFDLDSRQIERAGIAGYVARRFEAKGRDPLTVLLVCGPPGPISVHTPEVCYRGAGYEPEAFPVASDVAYGASGKKARLLEVVYRKPSAAGPSALRVAWTFRGNSPWDSPTNPRLSYATQKSLYKLYLIQDLAPGDESRGQAAVEDFARVLLPALDVAFIPPSAVPPPTMASPSP